MGTWRHPGAGYWPAGVTLPADAPIVPVEVASTEPATPPDVDVPAQTDTGPVEMSVRAALATYSGLTGMQAPLSAMALRLARAYDGYAGDDLTKLSRLNQELRQTLTVIAEVGLDDDDDRTGGLPAPAAPVREPVELGHDVVVLPWVKH